MARFLVAHGIGHGGALTVEARASWPSPFAACAMFAALMGEQRQAALCWRTATADDMDDVDPWDCLDHPIPADDPAG